MSHPAAHDGALEALGLRDEGNRRIAAIAVAEDAEPIGVRDAQLDHCVQREVRVRDEIVHGRADFLRRLRKEHGISARREHLHVERTRCVAEAEAVDLVGVGVLAGIHLNDERNARALLVARGQQQRSAKLLPPGAEIIDHAGGAEVDFFELRIQVRQLPRVLERGAGAP